MRSWDFHNLCGWSNEMLAITVRVLCWDNFGGHSAICFCDKLDSMLEFVYMMELVYMIEFVCIVLRLYRNLSMLEFVYVGYEDRRMRSACTDVNQKPKEAPREIDRHLRDAVSDVEVLEQLRAMRAEKRVNVDPQCQASYLLRLRLLLLLLQLPLPLPLLRRRR